MAAEVTYKLRADVNNGVLVKLTEFLKLPDVIEAGITLKDAKKFISSYYKRSMIDPLGSLMSAIWLQGEENSPYPFLDHNKRN